MANAKRMLQAAGPGSLPLVKVVQILFAGVTFFAACTASRASTVADGHWDGAVSRLGSVQTVSFSLTSDSTGKLIGRYDIPELGLFAEPLKSAALDGTRLTLKFLYGTFTMHIHSDIGDMTGSNQAWDPPVDLHLKRTLGVPTYSEESVVVHNGNVALAGTLFRPLQSAKVPLLIIVPGSDDRGRLAFEYRGYGPMLAQQGIAAFVYDKRNVGDSSKVVEKPTFADYASDANALVDGLIDRPGIDSRHVGLGGASQGGWIAPMAAATNKNVAFLVLLAGPATSVERQELDRVAATMRERSASASDLEAALRITQAYFDVGDGRVPLSYLQDQLDWLHQSDVKWSDVLSEPDPGETLQDAVNDWKRIQFDPSTVLKNTRIPILAFFGATDDEVPSNDNAPLMKQLIGLNNSHNRVTVIAGANHALFMGQRLNGDTWHWPDQYWTWDRRAPDLMPIIVSWIRQVLQ